MLKIVQVDRGVSCRSWLYTSVTAAFKPTKETSSDLLQDEYLLSGLPLPMNLLEPFAGDPVLSGLRPQLSALRIISCTSHSGRAGRSPVSEKRTATLFRAAPALLWRIRYSKLGASPSLNDSCGFTRLQPAFASCNIVVEKAEYASQMGKPRNSVVILA